MAVIQGVCGSDPDGGPAYDPVTRRLFVPCRDGGIQVIDVGSRRLGPRLEGANGAPIVVGGTLWAATYPDGGLAGFSTTSGRRLQELDPGPLPTFATPTFAGGTLLIGTRTGVVAFGR